MELSYLKSEFASADAGSVCAAESSYASVGFSSRVLALGFFDGVHLGHAALLDCAKKRAAELHCIPSVLSFDVHPDNLVLHTAVPLIGDTSNRRELLSRCFGITDVLFLRFDERTRSTPWQEFLTHLIREEHAVHLVAGHDFTFGANGEGTAEKMRSWCETHDIGCDIIPPVTIDDRIVSSTYIRTLIAEGKMRAADRLLGHPFCLTDTVRSGYRLGRTLSAPTVNMAFPDGVVVPRYGVYAAKAVLPDGSVYRAVTNVGTRPTVSSCDRVSVESHLLDFTGDLYGSELRVDFYDFLRPEQKFSSTESLALRIQKDIETVRGFTYP